MFKTTTDSMNREPWSESTHSEGTSTTPMQQYKKVKHAENGRMQIDWYDACWVSNHRIAIHMFRIQTRGSLVDYIKASRNKEKTTLATFFQNLNGANTAKHTKSFNAACTSRVQIQETLSLLQGEHRGNESALKKYQNPKKHEKAWYGELSGRILSTHILHSTAISNVTIYMQLHEVKNLPARHTKQPDLYLIYVTNQLHVCESPRSDAQLNMLKKSSASIQPLLGARNKLQRNTRPPAKSPLCRYFGIFMMKTQDAVVRNQVACYKHWNLCKILGFLILTRIAIAFRVHLPSLIIHGVPT